MGPPTRAHTRTALCSALLLTGLAAQSPQRAPQPILGLVRGADGAVAQGALVRAVALGAAGIPWSEAPTSPAVDAHTDERGRFSLALDGRDAALWIATGTEAALVPRAAAGAAVDARLAPLATIDLGADATGAHVRIEGVATGFVAGRTLDVPAGSIDLLVESTRGAFVASIQVEPGQRARAARPTPPPATLRDIPATARVNLPAWPRRIFAPAFDGRVMLPAADRPLVARVTHEENGLTVHDEAWIPVSANLAEVPQRRPVATVRVQGRDGLPLAGARVLSLATLAGRPSILAESTTAADGTAPHCAEAHDELVAVEADDHALTVVPAATADVIRLEPAAEARVRVVDDEGLPVPGAEVRCALGPLARTFTTDDRGFATLDRLAPRPLALEVAHDAFVPLATTVEPDPRIYEIALTRGLSLHGVVAREEGSAVDLDGVIVELHPLPGGTDMAPRFARADAEGRFRFSGLPDEAFRLFAHVSRRGITWSGRIAYVEPDEDSAAVLPIACDDPEPGRGAGGR